MPEYLVKKFPEVAEYFASVDESIKSLPQEVRAPARAEIAATFKSALGRPEKDCTRSDVKSAIAHLGAPEDLVQRTHLAGPPPLAMSFFSTPFTQQSRPSWKEVKERLRERDFVPAVSGSLASGCLLLAVFISPIPALLAGLAAVVVAKRQKRLGHRSTAVNFAQFTGWLAVVGGSLATIFILVGISFVAPATKFLQQYLPL